jgi:hypothetical protein
MQYEYKVIPAPRKGRKARGIKGAEERFSLAVQEVMNDHAAQGWEFLRSETLPSEERQGLTSNHTVFRSVLVFRRQRADDVSAFEPELLEHHPDSHAATAETVAEELPDAGASSDTAPGLNSVTDTDWQDAEEVSPDADRNRA